MSFILGGEHALHDHLVGTPIPDAENRRPEENTCPGKVRIAHRLDHVEIARGQSGAQTFESAHPVHSDYGQYGGAENQDQGLHKVGVDDCSESSCNGVNTRGDHQDHRCRQRAPAHHALQHNRRRIKMDGNFGEYVSQNGDARQIHGT